MNGEYLSLHGIQLFFAVSGAGQPLLFIHGNTGSSRWFSRAMDISGYRSYALDLPNFGRSDPYPGVVDLSVYADWVLRFMDEVGLEEPVMVGHSLGGGVVQALALRHPDRAKALILIDSVSPKGLVTPRERYPFIELMKGNRAILAKTLRATVPTLKDEALFELLVDDAVRMAGDAWIGNAEALSNFDVSGLCAKYNKRVLVLWGRSDFIVTEEMARQTAQAYPGAELKILEGCGHSVIVEDPGRFKEILEAFLADL